MEKENNEWLGYGREPFDVLAEALTFEKAHAPEFLALKVKRDGLLAESERLATKIKDEEDDLAQLKAGTFAELDKVPSAAKAKSLAAQVQSRSLDIVRLKLKKNSLDLEAANLATLPYLKRQEVMKRLFDGLTGTAAVAVKFGYVGPVSFDFLKALERQAKDLAEQLRIMTGKTVAQVGHSTGNVNDILSMAERLPEKALPALVAAWEAGMRENMSRIGIHFGADGMKWHITKKKPEYHAISTHDMGDYDESGQAKV